jgi:hypothetical protein
LVGFTIPREGVKMRKILLTAAVLALAGCGEKKAAEAPAGETTGEMAPAGTPADTGMMSHDTGMMKSDTMMSRDTAK